MPAAKKHMPDPNGTSDRHPLRAALGRALELALDRALALDPDTRAALAALEGREIAIALQAPAIALRLRVEAGRLAVGPDRGAEPDLSLRTTLGAVLAQLLPGPDPGALPVGQVRISGDAELARRIQQLVQRYDPDIEEAFTRVFGDVLGVQVARGVRRAFDGVRRAASGLARDTAEYLTEESRDLVPRAELDAFLDEVDVLRDGVERMERKIARVRERMSDDVGGKGT
jgi:ubiquinone biosynthesis protein UbiJ